MWKDWLTFSKGERYGVVVLATLVVLVALWRPLLGWLAPRPSAPWHPDRMARVDSFLRTLPEPAAHAPIEAPLDMAFEERGPRGPQEPRELFPFDPNTVTQQELVSLGFTPRQARAIDSYRLRGGTFRRPEDMLRLHSVDSAKYYRLRDYIRIPPPATAPDTLARPSAQPTGAMGQPLDLNSSDSAALTTLRGIGPRFAQRIVSYRARLGGFHSPAQLLEIQGFTPELLRTIAPSIWVDTAQLRPIDLNTVSYHHLRRHPYITTHQAKAIIYYRETMGPFTHTGQLLHHRLMDSASYARLRPYLAL